MNTEIFNILTVMTSLLFSVVEGTIMCSTCRSDKIIDCESRPPPPDPCPESGSGVIKSCSTIRVTKIDTGDLHLFIRSCSSTNSEKADCYDSAPGYRTCAQICFTDGCNSAVQPDKSSLSWLLIVLILIINLSNG